MTDEATIGADAPPKRRTGPHAPLPQASETTEPAQANAPVETRFDEEDPRVRAARRAQELRDHRGPDTGDGIDEFYIDPRVIPDGWSYEWKRFTTLGAQDPAYQVQLAMKGWEPVPAQRHQEMMPEGYRGETIERRGQILMERPKEITEEAKQRELRAARSQVRQKEEQIKGTPAGANSPFARDNSGASLAKIGRSYEPLIIPKDGAS